MGKYSNLLTVLLIIVILGIVGVLIFLGIDLYNQYYITKEADIAINKFDSYTNDINSNNATNNTENATDNNVIGNNNTSDINEILNNLQNTTTNNGGGSSTSSQNGQYFKGYLMKGTIEIPRTGIKVPVLEKATKGAIEVAVGIQYPEGTELNKPGNVVIAGHNYRNGLFFSNNKNIQIGDKIYIKDTTGTTLTYTVYKKYETYPEDTEYMQRNIGNNTEISLTTCTDDNSKRLIIWAKVD